MLWLISQLFQGIKAVQAGHDRPLVVQNSPTVDRSIFHITRKGRLLPAISRRNHIYMANGAHIALPCSVGRISDLIIKIHC